MKHKILLVVLISGILVLSAACSKSPGTTQRQSVPQNDRQKTAGAVETPAKKLVIIPSYQGGESLNNLEPTLSPEIFSGAARGAYQIAKEIPKTLAQVPCYCHCDKSLKHKSLHSCFTDDHASSCGICINEAFAVYKLEKEQKLNPDQIREKIIAQFGQQY